MIDVAVTVFLSFIWFGTNADSKLLSYPNPPKGVKRVSVPHSIIGTIGILVPQFGIFHAPIRSPNACFQVGVLMRIRDSFETHGGGLTEFKGGPPPPWGCLPEQHS